jgi:hypothetical protein
MKDGMVDPGFSSIFIPSCVVDPGFSSIFIPSRVVGGVWRTEWWTLDFPIYLSFLGLWVQHGVKFPGRKGGPWIFLYIYIIPFYVVGEVFILSLVMDEACGEL